MEVEVRDVGRVVGVKHLNPRQGITTFIVIRNMEIRHNKCETPESPPGDYNPTTYLGIRLRNVYV